MNLEEIKKKLEKWNIAYTDYRPFRTGRVDDVLIKHAETDVAWLIAEVEQSHLEIIKLRNKLHALEERAEKAEFELEQALWRERKREKRIW